MQIHSLQHAQATQSLAAMQRSGSASRTAGSSNSTAAAMPTDELDLSAEAQQIGQSQGSQALGATAESSAGGGIRWEKVNALRQAIAEGNYDTPERLSGAMDNFLDAYA